MPRKPRAGADLVGRAFRCKDGIVRWVFAQTASTGNLHIRWLSEEDGVWHMGGMRDPKKWPTAEHDAPGDEFPAPQPGDRFKLCGALGTVSEYMLEAPIWSRHGVPLAAGSTR